MKTIIDILIQIINGFFYQKPEPTKEELISTAIIHVGLPVSKHEHVNEFLAIMGSKILNKCINQPIFPSMAIAQAAHESGWNSIAKTIYGIKSFAWVGKTLILDTTEEYDGKVKKEKHKFRVYDNVNDCIDDYIKVLKTAPWFKDVINSETVEEAIHGLQTDKNPAYKNKKYATDSRYEEKLNNIINDFGLKKYDEIKHQVLNYV